MLRHGLLTPVRFTLRVGSRAFLPVYHRWITARVRMQRGVAAGTTVRWSERWRLPAVVALLVLAVVGQGLRASAGTLGERSLLARITTSDSSAELVESAKKPTLSQAPRIAALGTGGIGGIGGAADESTDSGTVDRSFMVLAADTAVGGTGSEGQTRAGPVDYTVQGGDTVSLIAANFGLGYKSILWSNGITEDSLIKPGAVLHIPSVDGLLYTIKSGDNLNTLVTKYRADLAGTLDVNHLPDPSAITAGQVITLVGGQPPEAPPAPVPIRPRSPFFDVAPTPGSGPIGHRIAGSGFLWPTPNHRINQYFRGYRHTGIDIEGTYSSPIYAAADGTVEAVLFERYGYGFHIIINHHNGYETLYSHASKIFVKGGQRVDRGQTIAMVGSTGRSSGTHVHFEIIINGVKVNPLAYFYPPPEIARSMKG